MKLRPSFSSLVLRYSHECTRHPRKARAEPARRLALAADGARGKAALAREAAIANNASALDEMLVSGVATSWELFDLEADPHEMRNVYNDARHAAARCALTRELLRLKAEARDDDELYCREASRPQAWTKDRITVRELCAAGQLAWRAPPPEEAPVVPPPVPVKKTLSQLVNDMRAGGGSARGRGKGDARGRAKPTHSRAG